MVAKHERQQLREAVVAQLKGPSNDRTAAAARVFKSRHEPAADVLLPAISVYSPDEITTEESAGKSPRELKRAASIVVVGWVTADDDVDDALDTLALQIENAMDVDPHFDRCAYDSVLESTASIVKLDGERPFGAISLTYACSYHTQPRRLAPSDLFDTVAAQVSLAGEQATDDQRQVLVTGIHGP